jgi:hypothetical protein
MIACEYQRLGRNVAINDADTRDPQPCGAPATWRATTNLGHTEACCIAHRSAVYERLYRTGANVTWTRLKLQPLCGLGTVYWVRKRDGSKLRWTQPSMSYMNAVGVSKVWWEETIVVWVPHDDSRYHTRAIYKGTEIAIKHFQTKEWKASRASRETYRLGCQFLDQQEIVMRVV